MFRYKLTLEYDGTPYVGWQRQRCGRSVEQTIEKALFHFTGQSLEIVGSGRTDAGVHAWGQVAHVDIPKEYQPFVVQEALNAHLRPHPITVSKVERVTPDFHARFSAIQRSYIYRILNRQTLSPFERYRAWHVKCPLEVKKMDLCAQSLVGYHDFSTFRDSQCQATSPLRTVESVSLVQTGDIITMTIQAPSFLHHQVRNIIGTLKWVGEGKWTKENFLQAFHAKDRTAGGPTAPPEGLYLAKIRYHSNQ